MRTTLLAAAAALSLSTAAFAGQQRYPSDMPSQRIIPQQALGAASGRAEPVFGASAAAFTTKDVKTANGRGALVQIPAWPPYGTWRD